MTLNEYDAAGGQIKSDRHESEPDHDLPCEYMIRPKNKIAEFSGDRWPFSNVEPAVYGALGLLYGRTERRDGSGALINDDTEYAVHNVLTGHAFGLFYCMADDSPSMALYGLSSSHPDISGYTEDEIITEIKDRICHGCAAIIDEGSGPFDYLIRGYKENGNILTGHKFEHGNDAVNCSYDFGNPEDFYGPGKEFFDKSLFLPNGEKPGGLTFIHPEGKKLHRDVLYKQALADGYRMLTRTDPPPKMDSERVHFGYGQAIYDAWIRQLERANAENSEAFYFASPVFPHFIALYENRLQLFKFLKLYTEICGDENLLKAADLCEKLKNAAQEGAQTGFENQWSDPGIIALTNNERRDLLIGTLKKCRALELEIAESIGKYTDPPETGSVKEQSQIRNI